MVQFQDLLSDNQIFFLEETSKEEALVALVKELSSLKMLPDEQAFQDALLYREKLMSTALGLRSALPHAKLPSLDHFFLAIGITKRGIEWGADDELPVRFIFLIGGPDNKPKEYLALLSSLTKAIRSEEVLKKLSAAKNAADVLHALRLAF